MKALITGAGGQIGMDLARQLRQNNYTVVGSDVVPQPAAADVDEWRHLDVTERDSVVALLRQVRPDMVFHLAAILSARGEQVLRQAFQVNEIGTFNLVEGCREVGIKKMLFASTIAVFGPGLPDPTPDDVPLWPTTLYGVNKVGGELLGNYYHQRFGFDFRAVRFPGLISSVMPGGGTSDYALYMYVDSVRIGAYEAFCDADSRIPFMYMPDALRAMCELAAAPRKTLSRCVYNIAAFSPSAQEIADSIRRLVPDAKLTFRSDPQRQAILDSWPNSIDDSNARKDWGWRPEFDLEGMTHDLIPKLREMLRQ